MRASGQEGDAAQPHEWFEVYKLLRDGAGTAGDGDIGWRL